MASSTQTNSYCVVKWEDNENEYAIVHIKRAKTSIALKVGLTTSFEGNNRDRRRSKILYIGTKNDCTVFSFQFEDEGGHVNTYSWSLVPGLFDQIEQTARAIKIISNGNLHRTTSSTSSTNISKSIKRKINHKEQHTIDNPDVNDISMISGSTSSTITISVPTGSSRSNDQQSSNSSNTETTSSTNAETTASYGFDSLLQENKVLREKIAELEEQLLLQRETSLRE